MSDSDPTQEILTTCRAILAAVVAIRDAHHAPKKEWFSASEVASLSHLHGVTRYSAWTIRQACNTGRVRGAKKEGNKWLLPATTVQRLLNHGLDVA